LARKADALRPLLREVERLEAGGSIRKPASPWRSGTPGNRLDIAAAGTCGTAVAIGSGHFHATLGLRGASPTDLWLRFTANSGGISVVSTAGSSFDTTVEVYGACPDAAGRVLGRGDDELGLQARAAFPVEAGETSWIRIRGWEGATGRVAISLDSGVAGIAGTVTNETTGQPLSRYVEVWDADGSFVTATQTNYSNGTYVVAGLAPGTYFAATQGYYYFDGLLDELYDGRPCAGGASQGCDPTTGTPITLAAGVIVNSVDFALGRGASVAGRVRDTVTGLGLGGSAVRLYGGNGNEIGEATTDAAGRYTVTGLGGGPVFAVAGGFSSDYAPELYQDLPCRPGASPPEPTSSRPTTTTM
jgi:hypothetical protein